MSLTRRCQAEFDGTTRMRGQAYAQQDAVSLMDHRRHGVWAEVDGSSYLPYGVDVDWSDAHRGVLRASCSCPRFADGFLCKHIWATLLTIDQQLPGKEVPGPRQLNVQRAEASKLADQEQKRKIVSRMTRTMIMTSSWMSLMTKVKKRTNRHSWHSSDSNN